MGGLSAEREISLRSGRAVWAALIRKGYDAIPLEVDASVVARLREVRAQIAFIALHGPGGEEDRKSTRLNSSHRCISYAVFCLKKKKQHAYADRDKADGYAHLQDQMLCDLEQNWLRH